LFYSHFLEPLFNEALNQDNRPGDVFAVTGTKVPYLNGGLFEKGELDVSAVNFPAGLFEELLEFFNRFNFTIDESDLSEREVGIDPEMLGHIFENLLEDNKDKGAFYTPKEIVHYMCQESLKEYLKTKLEEESLWPKDEEDAKSLGQALEAFIKRKEAGLVIDFDKTLATALRDVKICDPAIGSGAFPMGLLNEIYHCMFTLYHASPDVVGDVWRMEKWEPDTVKKNIIQNSIYGVDIEKGAVDIARLRFWLSLLIEEETPNPLPNLDYKIVEGNSLVSKLGNEIIDIDWSLNETSHGLFGNEFELRKIELLKKISKEQREFFDPESNKKKLAEDIRELKIDLLINQLELMVNTWGVEAIQTGGQANKRAEKSRTEQTEIYLKTQGWKNSINQLKKIREKPDQPLQFFDWKLDFPEVLNEFINQNSGFDIVIGNPPYINVERIQDPIKSYIFNNYITCTGRTDIYVAFIEKSLNLVKRSGLINFIIPYAYTNQNYGVTSRMLLINNFSIREIVDTSNYLVFENATVKNIIIRILNNRKLNKTSIKIAKKPGDFENNVFEEGDVITKDFLKLKNARLETKKFNLILELKRKIEQKTLKFEEICLVAYGVRVNHKNEKNKTKKHYISKNEIPGYKRFIEGKDIDRYFHKQTGWLNYKPDEHYNPMFKELFENEKIMFINVVSGRLRFSLDTDNLYNSHTVVNCVRIDNLIKAKHISARKAIKENSIQVANQFNMYYLLGVLNSNLINWYFLNFLSEGLHFYPDDAKSIPIKVTAEKVQQKVSELAKKIIFEKGRNFSHAILDQEIDNLVYRLYDLTYDEIKVIDPDCSLSREEYENIRLEG
jgi:hypothetical protein